MNANLKTALIAAAVVLVLTKLEWVSEGPQSPLKK